MFLNSMHSVRFRGRNLVTLVAAAASLALGGVAAAQTDHNNLEEDLPTRVEDAYSTSYLNRELQAALRYDRTGEGKDRILLLPRLEYGFARNWQVALSAPFLLGNAGKTGSGNTRLAFLHNFNTEGLNTPAVGLSVAADFPTGEKSEGIDTELKLIVTRTLGRSWIRQRLHLNVAWLRNDSARPGERRDGYVIVLGYDRPAGPDTILVADFYTEMELYERKTSYVLEVGMRRQLDPLTVLSFGLGAGIGRQSPTGRAMFGIQHSF